MKILHIWDTAGVASLLAKEQRKLGHEVKVLMNNNLFNYFGFTDFYGNKSFYQKYKFQFVIFALKTLRQFKPDIVHIHALWKIVPLVRLVSDVKIVLHLHGTDARYDLHGLKKYWRNMAYHMSDSIIYVTKDLKPFVPERAVHVANPIDIEHFNKDNIQHITINDGTALIFDFDAEILDMEDFLKSRYPDLNKLEIWNRKSFPIPYKDMPAFLAQYEYFIDIKGLSAMSKTGLEALALGMKVIDYEYNLRTELPLVHYPKYVTEQVMIEYNNVLNDHDIMDISDIERM